MDLKSPFWRARHKNLVRLTPSALSLSFLGSSEILGISLSLSSINHHHDYRDDDDDNGDDQQDAHDYEDGDKQANAINDDDYEIVSSPNNLFLY